MATVILAGMHALRELRALDFSTQIAGPYCTKLLADAGADVIKIEPDCGDPLRRWSATGADLGDADGALFRFLNASKRSVVASPGDRELSELIASADLVVESFAPGVIEELDLRRRHPELVLLSISPFGHRGPWANRPTTEFVVQAECGSIGARGLPGAEPFQAGGRTTEWLAGTYAAVGALAAVQRARRCGIGEHVDFSLLEVMNIGASNFMDLFASLAGRPESDRPAQLVETPSIEPTRDGYVGFCTNSAQQFSDFLVLIERPDLRDDPALARFTGRLRRLEEWNRIVHTYTRRHSTAEIIERASLLRIPVAPVNNGETVRLHEQLVARNVFRDDPSKSFVHPRPPYRIDDEDPPESQPAPRLGEHTGRIEPRRRRTAVAIGPPALPLEGLRILDLTAWWAGPASTQMLAALGAEVIHLESIQRPDGMRFMGGALAQEEQWWELSAFFLATNTNKRGLTLDLNDSRGLALAKRLIARSDVVVENFTPRVMEGFGLDWQTIHSLNPRTIYVRMPAFGLTGPWRNHPGFAQTMEQMSGLAWLTGHRDDQPRIQRGPCDPLAGMHAAFALLVALEEREATGQGKHVEVTMVEGALNAAAEQIIEFSAYGKLLQREGNRSPGAAPQGLYACRSPGRSVRWVALSVESDVQWEELKRVLGDPPWAEGSALETRPGRRAAHDLLDRELAAWFAEQEREEVVERLVAAGIPAGAVVDPRTTSRHPQLRARGFYEACEHPIAGRQPIPTLPFRYASVARWIRSPAPTLGQHNRQILGELGLRDSEIDDLEREAVIGTRPKHL